MTNVTWHSVQIRRNRLTTILVLSCLFALTIFGLVAVHGSFDMKAECVRRLHLARQHAREMPFKLWSERIEACRVKCSGALEELSLYWEAKQREGGLFNELLYKICSPRQWNYEKHAFRGVVWKFSLGIWAYFGPTLLLCMIMGLFFYPMNAAFSAGSIRAGLLLLDAGVRIYFLWIPEMAILWVLRWIFATSLTGHLVFAGYNLTWVFITLLVTIRSHRFPTTVKTIVSISLLVTTLGNVILSGYTLYTTFRFIHADSDVTITTILFFWLMLFQGELYPYFYHIFTSPVHVCRAIMNCFDDRILKED